MFFGGINRKNMVKKLFLVFYVFIGGFISKLNDFFASDNQIKRIRWKGFSGVDIYCTNDSFSGKKSVRL